MARAQLQSFLRRRALPVLLPLILMIGAGAAQAQNGDRAPSPANVAALIQRLQSPAPRTRRDAARALAAIKPLPPAAIPPLIQILKNPGPMPMVEGYAIRALTNAGARAIPALSRLLEDREDRNAQVRVAAVNALGGMARQEPAVWPILIGSFSDPGVQPFASMQVAGIGA